MVQVNVTSSNAKADLCLQCSDFLAFLINLKTSQFTIMFPMMKVMTSKAMTEILSVSDRPLEGSFTGQIRKIDIRSAQHPFGCLLDLQWLLFKH